MSPSKPCFVVLEGADGVGKSTLAVELAARLDAVLLSTPLHELAAVRSVVDAVFEDCPLARQVWYAATVLSASCRARQLLERGRSVVLDRYWLSTRCYAQVTGQALELSEVQNLLATPDLTAYLHAPLAVRRERVGRRACLQPHDRMTLSEEGHARLDAAYRGGASLPVVGRWLALDAGAFGPEELAEAVVGGLRGEQWAA